MSEHLERNKALVREVKERVWNAQDAGAIDRYHAADFRYVDGISAGS